MTRADTPRSPAGQTFHAVEVMRVGDGAAGQASDRAAAEEPLEIRFGDEPFVVIMRTPGADRELVAGFLLAERIITGADDLGTIRHCTSGEAGELHNVIAVTLTGEAAARVPALLAARRLVAAQSSCGVCGRRSIDDLLDTAAPIEMRWRIPPRVVHGLPATLRDAQAVFDETGGLHAAGLFDREGQLAGSAEDVGRHNAVDKVIGAAVLMERLPLDDFLLFVSGRTSFEIVQKAVMARIPLVASVSAPSSLAIDLARDANVTLLGFVRGQTFNIYTAPGRIDVS
jgi:FdhD protein